MAYLATNGTRHAAGIVGMLFLLLLIVGLMSGQTFAKAGTDDYRLSSGDILTFDFLDDAEVPVTLTVTSDGDVQFPLIGDLRVAGLTVSESLNLLKKTYIEKDILRDPKVSLNITTFRPIFVLGEVRNPGSFPFFSGMTIEEAIGLAGGTQTAATNPADRIIARARLRGEIDGTDAEIVHEAIFNARLVAQLDGRDKIDLKDVPEIAANFVKDASVQSVLEIEQRILDTDLSTSQNQVEILTQGIIEAEQGLKILDDLVTQQKEVVLLNDNDLERINTLRKQGLNTVADQNRAKSSASNEKARLLEIYAEMSRSRRELGNLRLQLAKLKADRVKDILLGLQERGVAIKKLISARQSAQEQYFLMATQVQEESKKDKVSFTYQIHRTINNERNDITSDINGEVLPGDVVVVAIAGI